MLDFETAWEQQKDFESLVESRQIPGMEFYHPNEMYGLAMVLRAWSGYPMDQPIAAVIPHGSYLELGDRPIEQEANTPFRAALTYPAYTDALWRSVDVTPIPLASPFLYVLELMRRDGVLREDIDKTGTLYFPSRSGNPTNAEPDIDETVRMLQELPDEMKPVTVCVFWRDYVNGSHKEFERRGFPVVCAGHSTNQAFLIRLVHLMAPFRYAISDSIGSSLFYATAAGLEASLVGDAAPDGELTYHPHEPGEDAATRVDKAKAVFTSGSAEDKQAETDYMLRRDALRTGDGLLADLLFAEKLMLAPKEQPKSPFDPMR